MKILALEFSTDHRTVAVLAAATAVGPARAAQVVHERGRATPALALIEEVLRVAGVEREEIEGLAVGIGPGSYAGIRAAIAVAQGWHLGLGTPLLGFSAMEALAEQARAAGMAGTTHFLIDAQRQEFYTASAELAPEGKPRLSPLRIISAEEAGALASGGAAVCTSTLAGLFPRARAMNPEAATLARLAQTWVNSVPADRLEPVYLRETEFVKAPPPRFLPS